MTTRATLSDVWAAAADLGWGTRCVACATPGRVLCLGCRAWCAGPARPARPRPAPENLPPTFAVADYDGAPRAAILAHKEKACLALERPLGLALAVSVAAALATTRAVAPPNRPVVLVPVPSARAAVRVRGDDPLRRLAVASVRVLRSAGVPVVLRPALHVARPVLDQAGLGAEARADNLANAFGVCRRHRLSGFDVVVLDDIVTTGSTAAEASRVARAAGASVLGVAVIAATARAGAGD